MREKTERIIRMTQEAQKIGGNSEIAMKQFEIAASNDDKEAMEQARIAAHEFLDQLLDLRQELCVLQNSQMDDIINALKKR